MSGFGAAAAGDAMSNEAATANRLLPVSGDIRERQSISDQGRGLEEVMRGSHPFRRFEPLSGGCGATLRRQPEKARTVDGQRRGEASRHAPEIGLAHEIA